MEPKRPEHRLSAPAAAPGSGSLRLPGARGVDGGGSRFPRVDDHLVEPETRQEMIRGERFEAQPAKPPHAERHTEIDYVIRGNVASGYVVATDLLTRVGPRSDFATDVCVRRAGIDPETGARYLEELAFEVVAEQSLREITMRAEDLAERGVRRLIAVFVKRREVCEWSAAERRFVPLPLDGKLIDPTLVQPVAVRALLEAYGADNSVIDGLRAKGNARLTEIEEQRLEEGIEQGRIEAIETACELLGIPLGPVERDHMSGLDASGLAGLLGSIKTQRRWP